MQRRSYSEKIIKFIKKRDKNTHEFFQNKFQKLINKKRKRYSEKIKNSNLDSKSILALKKFKTIKIRNSVNNQRKSLIYISPFLNEKILKKEKVQKKEKKKFLEKENKINTFIKKRVKELNIISIDPFDKKYFKNEKENYLKKNQNLKRRNLLKEKNNNIFSVKKEKKLIKKKNIDLDYLLFIKKFENLNKPFFKKKMKLKNEKIKKKYFPLLKKFQIKKPEKKNSLKKKNDFNITFENFAKIH